MKKIICISLLVIILCGLCFAFTACTKPEPQAQTQKIALTLNNYSDYIAVNFSYSCALSYEVYLENIARPHYVWVYYITTSRKKDVHFEDVTIEFTSLSGIYAATSAELDYDGKSICSFDSVTSTSNHMTDVKVLKISGYVIVA